MRFAAVMNYDTEDEILEAAVMKNTEDEILEAAVMKNTEDEILRGDGHEEH